MRHFVWVSFDLGVKGDYEGMYRWLDQFDAKECGDTIACLWYEHPGDLLQDLKRDIAAAVEMTPKGRVYVIRLVEGRMKGSFIYGRRRNAPWSGFAEREEDIEDSNA